MDKLWGLVGKVDNSGLGRLAEEFYNNLTPAKTLIVLSGHENFLDRFPEGIKCENGIPTLAQIDEFLENLDVVLTFETPYNWNLISRAKEKGIKTIIMPNFEWTIHPTPVEPDLWLCPSKLDYDLYEGNKVYLPVPIDRTKFPFKRREKARTFVFNNGHGGTLERNSLRELMQAISMVTIDVKFLIRSQVPMSNIITDSRTEIFNGDLPIEELYDKGDVFLFPHKFDGLSLPIQEAVSCGMPVISTDIYPHNTYMPKELLFEPDGFGWASMSDRHRRFEIAFIAPSKLAKKIEEFANQDIGELSDKMNEIAKEWDWNVLKDKYKDVIQNL